MRLLGHRVLVRRFQSGDAVVFQRYRNDPETAAFQGWEVPYTAAQADAFVAWAAGAPLGEPGAWCQLAVERRAGGGLVGDVGVHTLEARPGTVEVGVTLDPAARGEGIATEAVGLVLDHLRRQHGVACAVAWVHVDNHPSAELFRRLGFSVVATEPGEDGAEHGYERDIGSG